MKHCVYDILTAFFVVAQIGTITAFTTVAVPQVGGPSTGSSSRQPPLTPLFLSAPADSDFDRGVPVAAENTVDANVYNVGLDKAASLWTVSVGVEQNADRPAGVPFLDTKSKDYFVDDVEVVISRDGGMGMILTELAGGRDDDYGLTIIEEVVAGSNAEKAGVLPGDSLSAILVIDSVEEKKSGTSTSVQESIERFDTECKNFDATMDVLTSLDPDIASVRLQLKRVRRWPRIQVVVEYPPVQVAEGADNKETLSLFAGENLRRALLNRGIIMEDGTAGKCDFCGGTCTVAIDTGMYLMSPMSVTEEKIMKLNPKCRISCKTVVGYNMQEGNARLRVNVGEWKKSDKKKSSPFSSN